MWPGLKQLLHSLTLDPEVGQSRAKWPVFLHSLAICPDSLQFQQTVAEVHSAAKWLLKKKKEEQKGAELQSSLNKY
jgi:hypothetical protein